MTDIIAPARLTQAQIDAYRRDGLVIPDYRLPAGQLAALRSALDSLLAENTHLRPEQLISAYPPRAGEDQPARGN